MPKTKNKIYDKDFVPQNIEELYCSGWKDYMLYHIRRYRLNDVLHTPEDLLQDMLVQLAATGYLDKFDPQKSEFTVYLHAFIRNFMSKPYNREHNTVYGNQIVNYMAIVDSIEDSVENSDAVSYETLRDPENDFAGYTCLVQALENDLAQIKSKSQVEYNGQIIPRTPLTVYNMLKDGYDIKEIAEVFGTSKQFVYTLRKKIVDIIASYA